MIKQMIGVIIFSNIFHHFAIRDLIREIVEAPNFEMTVNIYKANSINTVVFLQVSMINLIYLY